MLTPDSAVFTARTLLTRGQAVALLAFTAVVGGLSGLASFAITVSGLVTAFYVGFSLMKVVIWYAGTNSPMHRTAAVVENDDLLLPTYTILVPLYREVTVFARLVDSLQELRYPSERLQILLLLEADDTEMREMVQQATLPSHFTTVVVPTVGPRTKPKACNYAMSMATGEYVVIFDAEDRPEPDQLRKAVAAMRAERARDPRVACVQAVLRFWNPRAGLPSRYYWAEYLVHFEWMLPGMRRLGLIPPLGGTSNHFHAAALWRIGRTYGAQVFTTGTEQVHVPQIWDSYNVTEDADLAARLARHDYRIGMFSALTLEEAPHRLGIALRQRTRWLQGYLITGLVHLRQPLRSARRMGPIRYLCFGFFMLGTPISLALSPIMWAATLTYLVARSCGWTAALTWYETTFPPVILYPGVAVMVVGNFLFFIQMLLTSLAIRNAEEAGMATWLLLTPLWWLFTSLSAHRAFWRLVTARSAWEKTPHGHDLDREESVIGHNQRPVPTTPTSRRTVPSSRLLVVALLLLAMVSCAEPTGKPGFRVADGRLLEPGGKDFVMRGVSYPFAWFPDDRLPFTEINARGANMVRVVLSSGHRWRRSEPADLSRVIDACRNAQLVCVLEVHDTTGYGEQPGATPLAQAVDYWISMRDQLIGLHDEVIINIGNEPLGNVDPTPWVPETVSAIQRLRDAGFAHTLMVDGPNWAQDWRFAMRDNAATVLRGDPARNTVFSVHMYEVFDSPAAVDAYLDAFVRARLPLVIGEFGPRHPGGEPDEDAIMASAQRRGIGYIGWSWSGNGEGREYLDLVHEFDPSRLTPWGERLFLGSDGIGETARATSHLGGTR